MDEIKTREKEFFDQEYDANARKAVGQVYSITHGREQFYAETIYRDVAGKSVLEYGCGTGSFSFELARRGADVHGIDISAVGIETAAQQAREHGLDNTSFAVMDAEQMTFADDSFDLVCGSGILHHLDLDIALRELARVVKPGGRAVFMEPLGHNPGINLFRRATPKLRTADEHPLVRSDLRLIQRYFTRTDCDYFHLLSLGSLVFLKTPFFFPVVRFLDRVDQSIFRGLPPVGLLAWYVVITMHDPRRGVD